MKINVEKESDLHLLQNIDNGDVFNVPGTEDFYIKIQGVTAPFGVGETIPSLHILAAGGETPYVLKYFHPCTWVIPFPESLLIIK